MDFRPTDAQRLLVAVAREFLDKHCSLDTAQELARNPDGRRAELWRKLADLGWDKTVSTVAFKGGLKGYYEEMKAAK